LKEEVTWGLAVELLAEEKRWRLVARGRTPLRAVTLLRAAFTPLVEVDGLSEGGAFGATTIDLRPADRRSTLPERRALAEATISNARKKNGKRTFDGIILATTRV
jgi:hypothetical protein